LLGYTKRVHSRNGGGRPREGGGMGYGSEHDRTCPAEPGRMRVKMAIFA
jgi:hypothetical protein